MTSITHRDITITQAEVPGAPFAWVHDDAGGSAEALDEAKRQINRHLKTPDPDCTICAGSGWEELLGWREVPCTACWGPGFSPTPTAPPCNAKRGE